MGFALFRTRLNGPYSQKLVWRNLSEETTEPRACPPTSQGLSRFSRSENGTVPFVKRGSVLGQALMLLIGVCGTPRISRWSLLGDSAREGREPSRQSAAAATVRQELTA
jgi:hypothetical protein